MPTFCVSGDVFTPSAQQLERVREAAERVARSYGLEVFDVQGRAVRTLIDQDAAAGTFVASWDGRTDSGTRATGGVYFARLTAGSQVTSRRIVLQ